jgi:hypothetical protein
MPTPSRSMPWRGWRCSGCSVRLCGASEDLRRLVAFAGLDEVLCS